MIALLVAVVSVVALGVQARKHAQRVERAQAFSRRANERASKAEERAEAAEQRLRTARETMLRIAEAEAARVASEPTPSRAIAYVMPVRALPRQRVSEPAPACPSCARHEVRRAIVDASRVPVRAVTGELGWQEPFTVRWGDC